MPKQDDTGDKPKRSRKKAKVDADQEAVPLVQPTNATETFFSMPEVFRHLLTYLDGKSLACMARVQKGWTYDVASVLYNEVDSRQLSKMSHVTTRRAIACNSVRSVLLRPGWCTDGMRWNLARDASTTSTPYHSDRIYHPALVRIAIRTIQKRFPNVRRLVADGRSAQSDGSRWTANFDETGTAGHIDLLYDVTLHQDTIPVLDAPDGFTISPLLIYVLHYDDPPTSERLGISSYDIFELDWSKGWFKKASDVSAFIRNMSSSGKNMSEFKAAKFRHDRQFHEWDDLLLALRSAPQIRTFHSADKLHYATSKLATLVTKLPATLGAFAKHNKELRDFSIGMSWDVGVEGVAYSWDRAPKQLSLDHLLIRLSAPPSTRLFNLAAYLSCFMATGGVLEFEWRKQNGKKATTHPLKEVVRDGDWASSHGASVLGAYTDVVAAFHRLADRSPNGQLPPSVDFQNYGVSVTRDIDHLTYDANGNLTPVFEGLVPRFLASCDYFVPTADTPEALFVFVRDCLANADNMLKLHSLFQTLDKSIKPADIAIIDGLGDLRQHVRKGGLKLQARLQKVEDDRVAAEKRAAEEAEEKEAAELEAHGKGKGKRKVSVKRETARAASKGTGKPGSSAKSAPDRKPSVARGSKAKAKATANKKAKSSSTAKKTAAVQQEDDSDDDGELTAGSYYVKDGWLVLDDETDEEGEYIPSSP